SDRAALPAVSQHQLQLFDSITAKCAKLQSSPLPAKACTVSVNLNWVDNLVRHGQLSLYSPISTSCSCSHSALSEATSPADSGPTVMVPSCSVYRLIKSSSWHLLRMVPRSPLLTGPMVSVVPGLSAGWVCTPASLTLIQPVT